MPKQHEKQRDKIAHGLWCAEDGKDDKVILIDSRDFVSTIAPVMAFLYSFSGLGFDEKLGEAKLSVTEDEVPSSLIKIQQKVKTFSTSGYVYDEKDFITLQRDMTDLNLELRIFCGRIMSAENESMHK